MSVSLVIATHESGEKWFLGVPSLVVVNVLHDLLNNITFVGDADTADWSVLPGCRDLVRELIGGESRTVYEIGIIGVGGSWRVWNLNCKPGGEVAPHG
jgi:hypothetical protein